MADEQPIFSDPNLNLLAAEIVKLKQEVAGLRAAIEKLEEIVGGTVNSLGGYYSGSVLKPIEIIIPE